MAFQLCADDVDLAEVGGKEKVLPGEYHMLVESVNEDGGEKGEMLVELQILRGTTPGMESKRYQEKFSKDLKKWPLRKMTAFALAARLITKEELEKNKSPEIEWTEARGRTICMSLENNEYEGKNYTRLAWDNIWSPIDKRASHIPLHAEALKRDGLALPANRHIDGMLAKPAATTQTTTAATAQASGNKKAAATTAAPAASVDDALAGVI